MPESQQLMLLSSVTKQGQVVRLVGTDHLAGEVHGVDHLLSERKVLLVKDESGLGRGQ